MNPSAYETVDFPSRINHHESIIDAPGESMAQKPQALEAPTFIKNVHQEESIPSPEKEEITYLRPQTNNVISQTPLKKKEPVVVKSPFVKPKSNIFFTDVEPETLKL